MSDNALTIINSESLNDKPANYTFFSSTGVSTIDTVWGNWPSLTLIEGLIVVQYITLSDHFPVKLTIETDEKIHPTTNNSMHTM